MLSSSGPFMPPAPVNPVGYGMPKKQYGPPFTNSVSSQMPMGPVNSSAPSNSVIDFTLIHVLFTASCHLHAFLYFYFL